MPSVPAEAQSKPFLLLFTMRTAVSSSFQSSVPAWCCLLGCFQELGMWVQVGPWAQRWDRAALSGSGYRCQI